MSEKVNGKVAKVFFYSDIHLRSSVNLFCLVFLFASLQGQVDK